MNQSIILVAKQDHLYAMEGWWVTMDGCTSFFMAMKNGQWRIVAGHCIADDLLDTIGLVLHPLALDNLLNFQRRPINSIVVKPQKDE